MEYYLKQNIINLSTSPEWSTAKKEWILENVSFAKIPERCICTHYPIIELCYLKNIKNNNIALVGNCCVKKFLELDSHKIFDCIKRLKQNVAKSLNIETLEFAKDKKYINDWEFKFYKSTIRKRKLSPKQRQKRIDVNSKILKHIENGN